MARRRRLDPETRFWLYAVRDPSTDCWEWTAGKKKDGYAFLGIGRGNVYGHRFSWELHHGPIPEGLELDHLCRNRGCVNPAHLEPVTRRTNVLRGVGPERLRHRNLTDNPMRRASA